MMLMMMTTLHQPDPNGAHGPGPALTVSEATKALGGHVSRSTIERAINARALPARKGRTPAGKPCVLVDRDDLLRWHARREGAAADDDDDDDVLTAHRPATADDDAARLAPAVAQERLGELLRGVQAQGIAEVGRQMQPLLERLEHAAERIGRLEAENEGLRRQAEEARRQGDDDPNAARRTPHAAGEQRRPWWRFWARG